MALRNPPLPTSPFESTSWMRHRFPSCLNCPLLGFHLMSDWKIGLTEYLSGQQVTYLNAQALHITCLRQYGSHSIGMNINISAYTYMMSTTFLVLGKIIIILILNFRLLPTQRCGNRRRRSGLHPTNRWVQIALCSSTARLDCVVCSNYL